MNPAEIVCKAQSESETINTKIQKELELLDKLNSVLTGLQDLIYGLDNEEVEAKLPDICCMRDAVSVMEMKIETALRKADRIRSGL